MSAGGMSAGGVCAGMRRLRPAGTLPIGLLVTSIAWVAGGATARAQGVLPETGVDTRVGDLRGYFEQAFGQVPVEAGTRSWTYSAAVDVSETYDTDVPISSNGNSREAHDLITRITPSVGVTGDSAQLTGTLFYSPTVNIYTFHGNQNGIDQNLNAAATATVIPDLFFVDVRAYAAEQALSGYNGPTGTTQVGSSNEALTTSFSISPTLRHSFSTVADAELGYTFSRTAFAANSQVATATAQAVNQNFISQEEFATVSTGQDFGQFNDSVSAQATQTNGTGSLSGASSDVITNTASYALTHSITVTGSIGYEDYTYGGGNPYKINDVTWSGGLDWSPNPDSSISIGYGHQQGNSSFYLNGTYAPTADTRIYARYSQGVGTEAQNLQAAVASSTVSSTGVVIDRTTGQPVLLTNNFFVTQTGLFRTTNASANAVLLWPRDLFTLSVTYQETSQLENGVASAGIVGSSSSSSGKYGSLSWSHDLSDDLHTNALVQYGYNTGTNPGTGVVSNGNQGSLLVNAGMSYSISDTLSVSAQFTVTTGPTGIGTSSGVQEIAIVSIHKVFF
jgi:uncharacterized protein (PEP-CTERM system associated)